jgi:hypothetical protein
MHEQVHLCGLPVAAAAAAVRPAAAPQATSPVGLCSTTQEHKQELTCAATLESSPKAAAAWKPMHQMH